MADLILYTNPWSRGRMVRWMLEEVSAPYETRVIAYGEEMKGPSYTAINPMGKVPAIQHGDVVVTETAAICTYLGEAFPAADLAPTGAARGAFYRWMFFGAGPLEQAIVNKACGFTAVPEDKQGMLGYGSLDRVLDALDGWLADHEYIAGDRFSAADVYVGSQLGWGLQFGTIEPRPSFEPYSARLMSRPAHARAKQLDDALTPKDS